MSSTARVARSRSSRVLEHEYAALVDEHPEWESASYEGGFTQDFGDYASVADLLRQIGYACTSRRARPAWSTPGSPERPVVSAVAVGLLRREGPLLERRAAPLGVELQHP